MLGLVALFGRASSHPTKPRVPHTQLCAVTGFSYATVTMNPVENGRGGRGTRFQQWAGVSTVGQGSGQGSMFGRGGFPSMTQGFHPGYDSRGPYSGYGGGRYGGRGRPGDWQRNPMVVLQGVRGRMRGTTGVRFLTWVAGITGLTGSNRLCLELTGFNNSLISTVQSRNRTMRSQVGRAHAEVHHPLHQ
jgi:hypothetical protein